MDTASTIIHAAGLAPPATVVMRCTFTGISSTTGTSALIEVENMAPPVQQQALDDPSQTYGIVVDGCVIENIQQKILIEADSANVVLRGSYIRDISLTNELDSRAINFLYATNAALAAAFLSTHLPTRRFTRREHHANLAGMRPLASCVRRRC